MHIPKEQARPCQIVSRNGETWRFATLEELKRELNPRDDPWLLARLRSCGYVDRFEDEYLWSEDGTPCIRKAGLYAVRYADGEPIPLAALEPGRKAARRPRHDPEFRKDPVPRRRRKGAYRGIRGKMRTVQEMRAAAELAAPEVEGGGRIGGRRRALPSSWSDIPRHAERSWKAHRGTQWADRR